MALPRPLAQQQHRLAWEASYNVRDLGGYSTANGQETRWGAFVRADNLGHLTAAGQDALIAYGITTNIDLRSTHEATTWPHAFTNHLTLRYVSIPLGEIVAQTAQPGTTLYEWNCAILDHEPQQIATILRVIAHAEPGGILLHCHAGKDRTGLVVAVVLALLGVAPAHIAADYAASDDNLQPLYAQWLAEAAHDPLRHEQLAQELRPTPELMYEVLGYVETRYGGVLSYVRRAGLSDDDIASVRERLCLGA